MAQIFVYGTLRKNMYNYDLYLRDKSRYIGQAYVKGELYTIQGVSYPALVPGESFILGEIYEISDDVELAIDDLEGYVAGNSQNEYNKVLCDIYNENKKEVWMQLPTYMFNTEKDEHKDVLETHIIENDYVSFMRKQSL